ncbi:MAG: shikimate dehydrogenase [Betaproteobacteria bacterium]|nr:MAG: shikimate dehydrogenase [Betaproteobacteria bacterium]
MDRYAVIGNPVAHSKSPLIHEAFARATGQRMSYERLLAPRDGFVATVERFVAEGGRGLNVTVPFKLEAYALAKEKSSRADEAQACNTLAWRGDHWYADNTDGVGLMRDLTHNLHEPLAGRDVLVLGAGGAARGIMGPLLAKTPRSVVVLNRTERRAAELAASFMQHGPVTALSAAQLNGRRFHLVINATSIGINGDVPESLWPRRPFAPGGLAYDLVYADVPTPFLRWASKQSAERMADGLGMLIEQAAESFVVWRGVRPETQPVFAMLRPGR